MTKRKQYAIGLRITIPCGSGCTGSARKKARAKMEDYLQAIGVNGDHHYEEIPCNPTGKKLRLVAEAHFSSTVSLKGLQKKAAYEGKNPDCLRQLVK